LRVSAIDNGLWREIPEAVGQFVLTVDDLKRTDYEKFMCVVCYNNNYDTYANGTGDENTIR
jgi:hypothetical protein